MNEEWKDIDGYNGEYKVSNHGRVFSVKSNIFLKERVTKLGYSRYALLINGVRKDMLSHRLVALHYLDPQILKKEINHKDGNKLNNSHSNLEWCSRKENMIHATLNGLANRGSKNPKSKLTEDDVIKIRNMFNNKEMNQADLARLFKVAPNSINNIVRNKTWTFLL